VKFLKNRAHCNDREFAATIFGDTEVEDYDTGNNTWLMEQSTRFLEPAEGNTMEEILAKVLRGDHQQTIKKISMANLMKPKGKGVTLGQKAREKAHITPGGIKITKADIKALELDIPPVPGKTTVPREIRTIADDKINNK